MNFNLRLITKDDTDILLRWHNDEVTRMYSFDRQPVDYDSHETYISNTIESSIINQYILEIDNVSVATIKDRPYNNIRELSYTVSPDYRGKRLSIILMSLYLYGKSGEYLCKINESNTPSIKMVERCGYKLQKILDKTCYYNIKI